MKDERDHFDDCYGAFDAYFGDEPERILVDFLGSIDPARPALDLGAGQGRNAVFLARNGVSVDAVDPSREAVARIAQIARKNGYPIRGIRASFQSFDPGGVHRSSSGFESYGAVCLFGLIQLLTRDGIVGLSGRVDSWSGPGTLVFVTAFTTRDPQYEVCRRHWRQIGNNSFEDESGGIRTFLNPGEAPGLFRLFRVKHHWEGWGPEHSHGDGPLQRHASVEMVLER
jgi:SAM-dependent methyltransferase